MKTKLTLPLILLLICTFILIAFSITKGQLAYFDSVIYTFVAKLIHPALTTIMKFVTIIGDVYCIVIIIVIFLLIPKTRLYYGVFLAINTSFSAFLNSQLKNYFMISRPNILRLTVASGFSFPSGHAMNNAALYFLICLITTQLTKNKNSNLLVHHHLCFLYRF
jgi:membrane-associated phospholipid phosphatase